MASIKLMTEHPELSKYHERWHRCEAVKLTRDKETGMYVFLLTDDLARAVHAEAGALFDEMDARAA